MKWWKRLRCAHPIGAQRNWGFANKYNHKVVLQCRLCGKVRKVS